MNNMFNNTFRPSNVSVGGITSDSSNSGFRCDNKGGGAVLRMPGNLSLDASLINTMFENTLVINTRFKNTLFYFDYHGPTIQ
jgi:hypothetical protein